MNDTMPSLLQVFRRLTQRHERTYKVVDPVTGVPEDRSNLHPPLLLELERLITESRSSAVRAVLQGSSVPLNSDAEELAREIRGTLQGFTPKTRYRFQPSLVHTAAEWLASWSERKRTPAEVSVWVETLSGWEQSILDLLNATVVLEARDGEACPVCGQSRVLVGDESKIALRVQYHPDDPAATCELVCRKCEVIAQGVHAVRAVLRITTIGVS